MIHKMPLDQFERVDDEEIQQFQNYYEQLSLQEEIPRFTADEATTGFIFCAELKFSKVAQKRLLSFPLAPEALIVDEEMMSKGQRETWKKLFNQPYYSTNHKKMVNCFSEKKEYVAHYQYLTFLAKLGVKVTIKRGYKFFQEEFIKPYVTFCSKQRQAATNEADKRLWKLMANIIYGVEEKKEEKKQNLNYFSILKKKNNNKKIYIYIYTYIYNILMQVSSLKM